MDIRDQLVLLYEISHASAKGADRSARQKELLKEAIGVDLRDSVNAPGLSRLPARRFIDAAILSLRLGNPSEALEWLKDGVAWYTGDTRGDLWTFEITARLDKLHGIAPSQERPPPAYAPTFAWSRCVPQRYCD